MVETRTSPHMDTFLQDKDQAVLWRGPKKTSAIRQFIADVKWGELDFLLIDSPPGTGDEHMQYSHTPQDVVILSPQALLWPGKYDFASTPLAGVNWDEVTAKSTSGTCSNVNGTFYYNVRYLGNVPLVFAVAESGNFPQGNGSVDQGMTGRARSPMLPTRRRFSRIIAPHSISLSWRRCAPKQSGRLTATLT